MASPSSAQQPARQRNAVLEFNTRMLKMESRLERTNTVFFSKHMSKCMATEAVSGLFAYALEFPQSFLAEHGKKFGKDITFATTESLQTWPITLSVRSTQKPRRVRVFAYGFGGWRHFVSDNHIKVGDILIFKLLRWSHFEVVIGRSPEEQDNAHVENAHQTPPQANFSNNLPSVPKFRVTNACVDNTHQASPEANSSNNLLLVPKFRVTICSPSEPQYEEYNLYLEKDLSLVVPSHFWELHNRLLQSDELHLEGPNKAISVVKLEWTDDEEVPEVRLKHCGWKAFLVANNLAIGDVLEFSLVANSSFKVDVVDRAD